MKKNRCAVTIFLMAISLYSAHTLMAQSSTYTISSSKVNAMKLSGTSTLHDWEMNTGSFSGGAQFVVGDGEAQAIDALSALTFTLPVRNLESDKNGLDKNAYKALKANKYENIVYKLASAKVIPDKAGNHLVKTNGNLTVAGVMREVSMDVHCYINKDASIRCSGSEKLKMTDYGVEPPTFLLGAMTTGDAITLDFTLVFKQ